MKSFCLRFSPSNLIRSRWDRENVGSHETKGPSLLNHFYEADAIYHEPMTQVIQVLQLISSRCRA